MTTSTLPHLSLFPAFAGNRNPALAAALRALPDFVAQEDGKRRIAEALSVTTPGLLKAVQHRQALVAQVADTARADKPQPSDLAKQAARAADAIAQTREAVTVLQDADKLLSEGRDHILAGAPAALLSHLDGQLQDTLAKARSLDLDGATTAQAAIDAEKVTGWQGYLTLTATYQEIRSAQAQVAGHLVRSDLMAQHMHTFAAIENYAEVFAGWFDLQRGRVLSTLNGEPEYATPPWDVNDPNGVWAYAVRREDVRLWVPTGEQLRDAYAAARADALRAEALEEAERLGQPLTPDEREWMQKRLILERQYFG